MASSRWHPGECWNCDAKASDGIHISATGLCPPCGERRLLDNIAAMSAKSGPNWQRWCAGMARAAGRGMLDDARNEA